MSNIKPNPFEGLGSSESTQPISEMPDTPNPFGIAENIQPSEMIQNSNELQKPQINLTEGVTMSNQNPNFNTAPNTGFDVNSVPSPFPSNDIQQGFPQQNFQQAPQQGFPQQNFQQAPQQGFPQQAPQQGFPQQNFQQAPQQGFPQSNNNGGMKYNIIDLYWLVNEKIKLNAAFEEGETQVCTIGFNADFNNMRFALYQADPNGLFHSHLTLDSYQKVANFNIHSEAAIYLLSNKGNNQQVLTQERVVKSGSWNPNHTIWVWSANSLNVYTKLPAGGFYSYSFIGPQIIAIENCLNFLINGNSWITALNKR